MSENPQIIAELTQLHRRVSSLEKQRRALFALVALACCSMLVAAAPWQADRNAEHVLRVRGIIVEDDAGRERILIGAPVPAARSRIRTDFAKASEAWGKRFPNMDWYRALDHSASGILILDERGHDRLAIGAPVPDPNIGARPAPSIGMAINDADGFEVAGFGEVPGHSVGLGLDHRTGEGLNLLLMQDGTTGMLVRDAQGSAATFVGHAPAGHPVTAMPTAFRGLLQRDASGPRLLLGDAGEGVAVEIRDSQGKRAFHAPER